MSKRAVHILVGSFICRSLIAADDPADKSAYHLFNPTPRELMRELSTDRPDTTETPYTVDAGHYQVEADLFRYSYDRRNIAKDHTITEALEIAPFNFKVGLCNNTDLQIVIPTYTAIRTRDHRTHTRDTVRGFGDMEVRMKMNFWGNDGGETALGLMPYIKLPTGRHDIGNNAVEGGLILPFAAEMPAGWGFGTIAQLDVNKDEDGSGHHLELLNTIAFSHDIIGALGGYAEFVSIASADDEAKWIGFVGLGVTYGLTKDIQLDAGINIGVTRAADDIQPFVGISWRF